MQLQVVAAIYLAFAGCPASAHRAQKRTAKIGERISAADAEAMKIITTSMRHIPLSKSPTAGKTSANDLVAMEKMEALLTDELKHSKKGEQSPTGIQALLPAIEGILKNMETTVKEAHDTAQPYINDVHAHIAACDPSANGTLQSWEQTYSGSLDEHKECRVKEKEEKTVYDNCVQNKASLKTIMDTKKELYDDENGTPTPGQDCESSAGEPRGDYLERLKDWFATEYSKWHDKKTAYETAKANYDSTTCTDTAYLAKKDTCDAELTSIENNACNYARGLAIQCNGYDDCYDEKVEAYETAKKVTQDQEAGRKVQWRAISRMKCIVNALIGAPTDATGLESCLNAAAANTDDLNVDYPAVPAKGSCSGPTNYPCTDSYKAAVYDSLPADLSVPTCNECTLPSSGSAGSGSAGSGGSWKLIAKQDMKNYYGQEQFTPASRTSFLMHPDDINADAYMIVGRLNAEDFRKSNGKFRFKLHYEMDDWNHNTDPTVTLIWEQSSWLTSTSITGFECIDPEECRPGNGKFKGLKKCTNGSCVFSPDSSWWNSVGVTRTYTNGCQPAWNGKIAKTMHLYVYEE